MFQVDEQSCIGCRQCVGECRVGAITMVNAIAQIDPARCIGCGACAEVCPVQAIADRPAARPNMMPPRTQPAPAVPPDSFVPTARPRAGVFAQIMQTAGRVFGGGRQRGGGGRGRGQSQNGQQRGKGKFRGGR